MQYYSQYLTKLQNWWWPPPPQLSPVQAFRAQLESSKINFITKHSDHSIIIERLCMMYSEITSIPTYEEFKTSLETPLQCLEIEGERIPSVYGKIKIDTEKIKFQLLITIVIHQDIENTLPTIFIRNSQPLKLQPNPKLSHIYQPVIGGLKLKNDKINQIYEGKWAEYKSTNMLNLLKKCDEVVRNNFPFVKKAINGIHHMLQIPQPIKELKARLVQSQLLEQIQYLIVTKKCLESERKFLLEENNRLNAEIKQQNFSYKQMEHVKPQNGESQLMVELLAEKKALNDVWEILEEDFSQKNSKLNFQYMIENLKEIEGKKFDINFKLQTMVEQYMG